MKHPANWFNSLRHALDGFMLACSERNFRFHLAAAVSICICGWMLHLSITEWAFILSAITLVLITELINTAIERFC
ncbi:MAG: diacylglycerol kinase family protein, partial [Cytophagales bacterium]|nr:diacylglycerol kinase family protein [Cytophaga sp.]